MTDNSPRPAPALALRHAAFSAASLLLASLPLSPALPVLRASLLWLGVSNACVAHDFARGAPGWLGKRSDGSLPLRARVWLGPYLLLVRAFFELKRLLLRRGEPASVEVSPGLHVGRRPLPHELPPGVEVVVDLTCEFGEDRGVVSAARYECLPTLNRHVAPDAPVRALLDRLDSVRGPILVHCGAGRGRSPAVAAAILVRRGDAADVDSAIAILQRSLPNASLHPVQRAQVSRVAPMPPGTRPS